MPSPSTCTANDASVCSHLSDRTLRKHEKASYAENAPGNFRGKQLSLAWKYQPIWGEQGFSAYRFRGSCTSICRAVEGPFFGHWLKPWHVPCAQDSPARLPRRSAILQNRFWISDSWNRQIPIAAGIGLRILGRFLLCRGGFIHHWIHTIEIYIYIYHEVRRFMQYSETWNTHSN